METFDGPGAEVTAIAVQVLDAATVVSVSGDLDAATSPALRRAITGALTDARALVIDLTDVDFLASAGLTELLVARSDAHATIPVVVVAVGRSVRHPIELTGVHRVVPVFGALDDALRDVVPDRDYGS